MNRIIKGLLTLIVVFALIASAGCNLVSVNEEKDGAQIVAKIGDVELTKAEFLNQFYYVIQMYQSFGQDLTADTQMLEELKTDILNDMVLPEVQYHHAVLQGFNVLTPEQAEELESQVNEIDLEIYNAAKEEADLKVEEDPDLIFDNELIEAYKSIAEQYIGEALTQQETRKWLEDFFTKNYSIENLRNSVFEEITITDEEVKKAFDEQLALDKTSATDTPEQYKSNQEYYERSGETGLAPLVVPQDYIRVKYIKIVPDEELNLEYSQKKEEMDVLEKEMGALTLSEEKENNARLNEIKEEYAKLKAETEKMQIDRMGSSKELAKSAYERLNNGESFDAVMAELTEDTDYKDYEIFKTKGKLMYKNLEVEDWPKAIKEAVLALTEKGMYTGIIEDEEGFHILQYVGDETPGERTFSDFEEYFREDTLSIKQAEEWETLGEEWMKDTGLVTLFPDVLKDV